MRSANRTDKYPIDTWNEAVRDAGEAEVLQWASRNFKEGLYCLSSFGTESAVMLRLLQKAGLEVPIIAIDTGFWFPETHKFKADLEHRFDLNVITYGPSEENVRQVEKERLWENDITGYHEMTKLEPLRRAINELGATALLSGVRHDQTKNRKGLQKIANGNDGELRIHPILDWTQEQTDAFIAQENLPRHPLFDEGFESVGDWTTTKPGAGRSGREGLGPQLECGLHMITR